MVEAASAEVWRDDVVVHVVPVDIDREDITGEGVTVNAWQPEPLEATRARALQATVETGVFMVEIMFFVARK